MSLSASVSICPLHQAPVLHELTLVRVKLDAQEARRLACLGLRTGGPLKVLSASESAGYLIAAGDARIAVNADTARKLFVHAR